MIDGIYFVLNRVPRRWYLLGFCIDTKYAGQWNKIECHVKGREVKGTSAWAELDKYWILHVSESRFYGPRSRAYLAEQADR